MSWKPYPDHKEEGSSAEKWKRYRAAHGVPEPKSKSKAPDLHATVDATAPTRVSIRLDGRVFNTTTFGTPARYNAYDTGTSFTTSSGTYIGSPSRYSPTTDIVSCTPMPDTFVNYDDCSTSVGSSTSAISSSGYTTLSDILKERIEKTHDEMLKKSVFRSGRQVRNIAMGTYALHSSLSASMPGAQMHFVTFQFCDDPDGVMHRMNLLKIDASTAETVLTLVGDRGNAKITLKVAGLPNTGYYEEIE